MMTLKLQKQIIFFNAIPDDNETTIKFENGERSEIVVKPVKFSEEDTK